MCYFVYYMVKNAFICYNYRKSSLKQHIGSTNRIIALAMAAMTALSMTACSGSAKETTEAESAAETTAEAAEESSAEETKEASGETLLMATTTSTDNTGLLDYLKPIFLEDTGIDLQWTAVGTGDIRLFVSK